LRHDGCRTAPVIEHLFNDFTGKETFVKTDIEKNRFLIQADGHNQEITFEISEFDRALVEAGGWVEYADLRY